MSKIVTATAACRLADEGRLDLDAPVDEYVEYLQAAPGTTTPNVGQLLNHTAGFGNPMPARYSNVGYLAAGQVIAAAAGMPFGAYVRQSVLKPVGMEHTGFRYQDGAERATGYVKAPRLVDPLLRGLLPGGIAGPRHGPDLSLNPFYVDGPAYGGLVGDVLDAGRFLRLHLRDGEIDGTRVLSPGRPGACAPSTSRVNRSTTEPAGSAGRRGPRAVGGALRRRRGLLERHGPLPRQRSRRRCPGQQHPYVRLRTSVRPSGVCAVGLTSVTTRHCTLRPGARAAPAHRHRRRPGTPKTETQHPTGQCPTPSRPASSARCSAGRPSPPRTTSRTAPRNAPSSKKPLATPAMDRR